MQWKIAHVPNVWMVLQVTRQTFHFIIFPIIMFLDVLLYFWTKKSQDFYSLCCILSYIMCCSRPGRCNHYRIGK